MSPRHHLVPRFYLKNFANEKGQVALVDRDDTTRVHINAVTNACAEVGFYRIESEALARPEDRFAHDPEAVEEYLSKFETAAAPAVDKLIKTGLQAITPEEWYHLVNHIALQTVRGKRWREDLNALGTQAMRTHLAETLTDDKIRSWLERDGTKATQTDIDAFRHDVLRSSDRPRLVASNEMAIQEGLKLALGPLGERLADQMTWTLIDTHTVPVLTSDEPVCWWAPGHHPVGYGTAKVVWLPLGRTRILQLHDSDTTAEELGLPPTNNPEGCDQLVTLINTEIAAQGHRWIVHHPDDQPLNYLQLPPRTSWQDQLVDTVEGGSTRREIWIHRRLPISPEGDG